MRAELLYQSREIGARKVCTARVVRDGTQIDRRGDGRALCTVRPAPNPKQDAAQWRSTNGASCAMRSGTRPRVAMQGAARLVASATAQRCWDGWALWQVCEGSSHARVLWAALHTEAGPSCKTHTYMYVADIGLTGMAACSRPCERRYPNLYASHTASFSAGSAVQCSAVQCSAAQRSAAQCSAVQRSAVQCSAVQCAEDGLYCAPIGIADGFRWALRCVQEIDFWKRRLLNLEFIHTQMSAEPVRLPAAYSKCRHPLYSATTLLSAFVCLVHTGAQGDAPPRADEEHLRRPARAAHQGGCQLEARGGGNLTPSCAAAAIRRGATGGNHAGALRNATACHEAEAAR
jgi:hypothetical protein